MNDRLYPARPILGVSVAVFRDGRVLIGRRARAPMAGRFSLPGGAVETGETLRAAAARELMEEVGVEAEGFLFNAPIEAIERDECGVRAHYVIVSLVARWRANEPRASAEIDGLAWIDPAGLDGRPTTPGLSGVLASAARIAEAWR